MTQNELYLVGATQIAIGLSQVIRVVPSPFQYSSSFKILSGGSLEIVPPQLSGTSTAAGNAWTKGYLVGTSEALAFTGPAVIYFAATGATSVIQMTTGYTSGATTL